VHLRVCVSHYFPLQQSILTAQNDVIGTNRAAMTESPNKLEQKIMKTNRALFKTPPKSVLKKRQLRE